LGDTKASGMFGQKLEGDVAAEFEVLGLIDYSHTAASDLLQNPVMRNRLADHWNSSCPKEKHRRLSVIASQRECPTACAPASLVANP
jgi:hypothetical protein